MLAIAWERRAEYAFHAPPLAESVARAKALGLANPGAPVLLIDHCDNCGSGGAQDVMTVVAEVLRQELDDVAIAPIRDPRGGGDDDRRRRGTDACRLALGGHTDMPSIGLAGKPLGSTAACRRSPTASSSITGPMYTGVRTFLGRTAVLERDTRPRADRRHRAPARALRPRRVHARGHRPAAEALRDAEVAHPLPRRVQADRRRTSSSARAPASPTPT